MATTQSLKKIKTAIGLKGRIPHRWTGRILSLDLVQPHTGISVIVRTAPDQRKAQPCHKELVCDNTASCVEFKGQCFTVLYKFHEV